MCSALWHNFEPLSLTSHGIPQILCSGTAEYYKSNTAADSTAAVLSAALHHVARGDMTQLDTALTAPITMLLRCNNRMFKFRIHLQVLEIEVCEIQVYYLIEAYQCLTDK